MPASRSLSKEGGFDSPCFTEVKTPVKFEDNDLDSSEFAESMPHPTKFHGLKTRHPLVPSGSEQVTKRFMRSAF